MSEIPVVDKRDRSAVPEYEEFVPILDRVLIKQVDAEEDVSGFAIPLKYRQHTNKGTVIALGQGVTLGKEWHPLTEFINVGDVVLYGEYTAEKFVKDGVELYNIRVQDIRGVSRLKK